jgi:hypothetical protein
MNGETVRVKISPSTVINRLLPSSIEFENARKQYHDAINPSEKHRAAIILNLAITTMHSENVAYMTMIGMSTLKKSSIDENKNKSSKQSLTVSIGMSISVLYDVGRKRPRRRWWYKGKITAVTGKEETVDGTLWWVDIDYGDGPPTINFPLFEKLFNDDDSDVHPGSWMFSSSC